MNVRNLISLKSSLFENKTVKQTIFKNTFWLATAEGITRLLKLILFIYVARILGATEYGKFTFALAFVSLFAVFSDFGLSWITTREFSQQREREKEFSSILSLKILLSIGTLILILYGSLFITSDPIIQKVIRILALYVVINNFSGIICAVLRARQKMQYESWGRMVQALVVTSVGFFVLFNFPSVENLSYAYLFASLIAFIFISLIFHFKIFCLTINWNKIIWKDFLGLSWPLAFITVFTLIYTYIDSVMMGYWGQITEIGWYNAAYKIVNVTLIPMALISVSFFPVLSKAFKESKERLQEVFDYQIKLMTILTVPIVIGGIFLAPKIINFVYGSNYSPSILVFQMLMFMAGFIFLSDPCYRILIVINQQKKVFYITLTGAIINIILNFILIPNYSLYGAAIATVITYLILFFLFVGYTKKIASLSPFNLCLLKTLLLSLPATLIMCFVISRPFIYNLNVLAIVPIGGAVYFFTFIILEKFLNPKSRIITIKKS